MITLSPQAVDIYQKSMGMLTSKKNIPGQIDQDIKSAAFEIELQKSQSDSIYIGSYDSQAFIGIFQP